MTILKKWNWQQDDWPHFNYESDILKALEEKFIQNSGISLGLSTHLNEDDKNEVKLSLISTEALKTSEIEGEMLDRESLQASLKRQMGYQVLTSRNHPAEQGIAEMMIDAHNSYDAELTQDTLTSWHLMLMNGRRDLQQLGAYRTHTEPMQVVSGYLHHPKVHFEAPASADVPCEMKQFMAWFNDSSPQGKAPLPALTRASICHLYFLCIHPFEDGNGRIGRALVEKVLAQQLGQPTLISLSTTLNEERQRYYDELERQNKHNEITNWLIYFGNIILKAQHTTLAQLNFIIQKAKFFDQHKSNLNDRQIKVIKRMMKEGEKGFEGGLSAKNYMAITGTTASTATRDLSDLTSKKIMTQTGERKATRYYLNLT